MKNYKNISIFNRNYYILQKFLSSPNILCKEGVNIVIFELYVDKKKNKTINHFKLIQGLNKFNVKTKTILLVKEKTNDLLCFENLSWCPIDRDLIKKDLLNHEEIDWLNNYHSTVYDKLNNYINHKEKKWLKLVTEPL